MKRFIGIVPPFDIYNTIVQIQNKYGDNRLEPHITLIVPVTVIEELKWISSIENICKDFSSIEVKLPATGNFGKKTLFIEAESEELHRLHNELSTGINSYQNNPPNQFENQPYHPHLTLGRAWCGFSKEDFKNMRADADEYLSKESITFIASFLRIYHKPSLGGKYEKLKDIEFGRR
jgi:2'-5' RNA ligase